MTEGVSRRDLVLVFGAAAATVGLGARAFGSNPDDTGTPNAAWPNFPHLDPKLVAEIVGKSHFDLSGVQKLVEAHPPLVNASWDWGFGDWETALGAAAHTGRRPIAEYLLEKGARIDIFAAAMLGYTDVVKAFVEARPGVQRTLGPHGIPLLAHAKAGGDKAYNTFEYLKSLGDAGNGPEVTPIEEADRKKYVGTYAFGAGANDRVVISLDDRGLLIFQSADGGSRIRMHFVGNDSFFPAGVPTTRLAFDLAKSPPALTIGAGAATLTATRTLGP